MQKLSKEILQAEVKFKTARSSGKGGQHVNKTETKVVLFFHVDESACLNDNEKRRVSDKLHSMINADGYLVIQSESQRSQYLNKKAALEKLREMLIKALKVKAKRIPTKKSKAQKEKRLQQKKQQAEKKKFRQKPDFDK